MTERGNKQKHNNGSAEKVSEANGGKEAAVDNKKKPLY